MKRFNVAGKTARKILCRFRDQLHNQNITGVPISSITNRKAISEIKTLTFDLLNTISGNEPYALLNKCLTKEQKLNIEPLNTVCILYNLTYESLLYFMYFMCFLKY